MRAALIHTPCAFPALQLPEEGSVRLEDTPGPEGDNAITLNYYVNPLQVLKGFVKLLSSR